MPFSSNSLRIASAFSKFFSFFAAFLSSIFSRIYASISSLTVSVSSAAPEVRFRDNTSSKLRTSSSFVLSFISSFNNSYKTVIPMDVLRSFPSASRNFFLYPSNLSCSISPSSLSFATAFSNLSYAVFTLSMTS